MSDDAIQTLGSNAPETAGRDAVHIAVVPMIARTTLYPCEYVGPDGMWMEPGKGVAIVDPFRLRRVDEGERFWALILPRTITGLRHVWSHPDFPEEGTPEPVDESREWIERFAGSVGLNYHQVMTGAEQYLRSGSYLDFGELLEGEVVPDEFWPHYERITGKSVPDDERGSFFTCTC